MAPEGKSMFEITVDHDLWKLAQKFDALYNKVNGIKNDVVAIGNVMKDSKDKIYEGRGREELDLFISAYSANIDKLVSFYVFCSAYVSDTLMVMMEFDETLKKKFEEGVMQYATKYPDATKKLFGEQ